MSISKAQQKAVSKYESINYDKVLLRIPKGERSEIQAHAAEQGESLNAFVNRAINETKERDKQKASE